MLVNVYLTIDAVERAEKTVDLMNHLGTGRT